MVKKGFEDPIQWSDIAAEPYYTQPRRLKMQNKWEGFEQQMCYFIM